MIKSLTKYLEDKIIALDKKKEKTDEEKQVQSVLEKRLKEEIQQANIERNFGPICPVPTQGYKHQREKDQGILDKYYKKKYNKNKYFFH